MKSLGIISIPIRFTIEGQEQGLNTIFAIVEELGCSLLLGRNFIAESGCIIDPIEKSLHRRDKLAKVESQEVAQVELECGTDPTMASKTELDYAEKWAEERLDHVGSSVFFEKAEDLEVSQGLVKVGVGLPDEERIRICQVIESFLDIFAFGNELGDCSIAAHKIELLEEKPISMAPYRLSLAMRQTVLKQVREWIEAGVVRPSRSPWASPVVVVPKKDGSSRICVDYRRVNKATRRDAYPLPNLDDLFACLNGSTVFSSIDLNQGYLQVQMDPESVAKTAFIIQDGLFEFTRMPFGLTNAPATFQRVMDNALSGLKWSKCLVYLDDVVIISKTNLRRTREKLEASVGSPARRRIDNKTQKMRIRYVGVKIPRTCC